MATDSEVKQFAAKHGPANLVVLATSELAGRPGWFQQSQPNWNFKGKWLVDKTGTQTVTQSSGQALLDEIAAIV